MLVSIHAPTKGATWSRQRRLPIQEFQSTLPRRERPFGDLFRRDRTDVSIHAPTKGATHSKHMHIRGMISFNPRSHEGSDRMCRATHCRIHEQQIKISVFKGKTDILPSPIEECHKEVEVARINKLLRSPCYFCIFMDKYRQAIKDYYATVPINLMFCALIICI